jgi:hypothetical protein
MEQKALNLDKLRDISINQHKKREMDRVNDIINTAKSYENNKDKYVKGLNNYLNNLFPTAEDLKKYAECEKRYYNIIKISKSKRYDGSRAGSITQSGFIIFGWTMEGTKVTKSDKIRIDNEVDRFSLDSDTNEKDIFDFKRMTVSIKYILDYMKALSINGIGKARYKYSWFSYNRELYYAW